MKKNKFLSYLPFFFVIAVIPLIASGKKYLTGLTSYVWYATNDNKYDFFLYWKSRAIMVLGLLLLLTLIYLLIKKNSRISIIKYVADNRSIMVCLSIYTVFILLSAAMSEKVSMAFWGGYEQFEGAFVLLTYILLSCYAFYSFHRGFSLDVFYRTIMIGVGILSGIGFFQFFKYDFFRSDIGKDVLRFMEPALRGLDFNFNFGPGRVYLASYNPNYVGSYVVLLLPMAVGGIFVLRKIWQKILLGFVFIFLIVSHLGSESVTGYVGFVASIILLFVFLIPSIKRLWKVALGVAVSGAIVVVLLVAIKPDIVQYAYNKVLNSPENDYAVEKFEAVEGRLFVYSHGKKMQVAEGAAFVDDEFKGFTFTKHSYTDVNKKTYEGYNVTAGGFLWNFVYDNGEYKFFNVFEKVVPIRDIPAIGFKNHQHFGSRRGYIWSRTIPLIRQHIFIGSGPDHFVMTFPNDDYVGLENNNYRSNVLTKPHNMYMQIAVQTGLVSLIAFVTFYFIYFVQSVRLYFKRKKYGAWEITGISILLGTFGYMIAGLANDSSVTVAPVFWVLTGIGLAVNWIVKNGADTEKEEQKKDNKKNN